MPRGYKKDGTPIKPPGRKGKGKQHKCFRLCPDVIDILHEQPEPATYVEDAVREKHSRS